MAASKPPLVVAVVEDDPPSSIISACGATVVHATRVLLADDTLHGEGRQPVAGLDCETWEALQT